MGRRTTRPFDPAAAERQRQAQTQTRAQTRGQPPAQVQARLTKAAELRAQAQAEALRPDTWGVDRAPLTLAANADVQAKTDTRGRVVSAHRTDVFETLHARGGLGEAELAAARRLERDIGLRAGLFRPETSYVLIDSQGSSEGITQRMVEAGRRVDAALAGVGPRQALLLRALIEPAMLQGRAVAWRDVTARETGEDNPHAQAAMVRAACADLVLAYQAIDAGPKARR